MVGSKHVWNLYQAYVTMAKEHLDNGVMEFKIHKNGSGWDVEPKTR